MSPLQGSSGVFIASFIAFVIIIAGLHPVLIYVALSGLCEDCSLIRNIHRRVACCSDFYQRVARPHDEQRLILETMCETNVSIYVITLMDKLCVNRLKFIYSIFEVVLASHKCNRIMCQFIELCATHA